MVMRPGARMWVRQTREELAVEGGGGGEGIGQGRQCVQEEGAVWGLLQYAADAVQQWRELWGTARVTGTELINISQIPARWHRHKLQQVLKNVFCHVLNVQQIFCSDAFSIAS